MRVVCGDRGSVIGGGVLCVGERVGLRVLLGALE